MIPLPEKRLPLFASFCFSYTEIRCAVCYTHKRGVELIAAVGDQPFVPAEPKNHLLYRGFFSRAVPRRNRSLVDRVPRSCRVYTVDDHRQDTEVREVSHRSDNPKCIKGDNFGCLQLKTVNVLVYSPEEGNYVNLSE